MTTPLCGRGDERGFGVGFNLIYCSLCAVVIRAVIPTVTFRRAHTYTHTYMHTITHIITTDSAYGKLKGPPPCTMAKFTVWKD